MKVDFRAVGGNVASLAWVALRSFLGTLLVLTLAGIVLAAISYYFLLDCDWIYRVIAVAVALIEGIATGFFFGIKRAMVMTAAYGLGKLRLGRSLVRLVFERMLGIVGAEGPGELAGQGERGGRVAQALEKLPLAQAEAVLNDAIQDVTGDAATGGWLRRTIQRRLLKGVQKYTLARFRQEGAKHGGVDLWKVKEELELTVDDLAVRKVRSGLRLWTWLIVIGLPFVVALQTILFILLFHAKKHG